MLSKKNSLKSDSSSMSKFFTLILEELNEDGLPEATKVPAKKGKGLYDCVQHIIENYGMSCETHSLFLGSSNTPLPLYNNDAYAYREQTLYVRANERSLIIPFAKTRSDSKKAIAIAAKRFSQLLDDFEPTSDKVDGEVQSDEDEFRIESSWKDVITEREDMTDRRQLQQEGVWELLTSEIGYIKDLKVIIDVFKRCFKMLQYAGYLTEVDETLIFANIENIYDVNLKFWKKLKLVVENARITREPISPSNLSSSFENFEHLFQPYIEFCNADTSNLKLPDYPPSTNELIKKFTEWCNNHKACKRLKISGFLIKPLQRVTKYSLLVKAIMNKTEDVTERTIAEDIMSRVETFVSKINSAVHLRQEMEKMDSVIVRLSEYYPIEMFTDESEKIIKEYCKLDFRGNIPGLPDDESRFILKEGAMKLVEKQGKRDVYVFLFSDLFVITKLKKNIDKYRIIRQPYRLNKILLHNLKDSGQILLVYLNEYGVVASACVLQTPAEEQEKWKTAIELARENYDVIRQEFALREDFWDDDFPLASFSTNEGPRRRASSNAGNSLPMTLPDQPTSSNPSPPCTYEWDNVLRLLAVLIFIALNICLSHFIG